MRDKKSEEANIEKRKKSFFFIGLIIALAVSLIAFEWASSSRQNIELARPELDEGNVVRIDYYHPLPEKPKPISMQSSVPSSVVDDNGGRPKTQFTSSQGAIVNPVFYPEGEFVDPFDDIRNINPFPGQTTRSIFDIDERPHFESCLNGKEYNPLVFDCTVEQVFQSIQENLKVPECVKYSSGKQQIVLAMVALDKLGEMDRIVILNSDAVCSECVRETARILSLLPKMNPGIYAGNPIPVAFTIPIKFQYLQK